jgi:hypothetical protein
VQTADTRRQTHIYTSISSPYQSADLPTSNDSRGTELSSDSDFGLNLTLNVVYRLKRCDLSDRLKASVFEKKSRQYFRPCCSIHQSTTPRRRPFSPRTSSATTLRKDPSQIVSSDLGHELLLGFDSQQRLLVLLLLGSLAQVSQETVFWGGSGLWEGCKEVTPELGRHTQVNGNYAND